MAKKLLNRFENSPKVWTIIYEENHDDSGHGKWVKKVYNSIADAHRDLLYFSCSHIEDYCNSTYFSRSKHLFAYDGYYMPFTVEEVLSGKLYMDDNTGFKAVLGEKIWFRYSFLLSQFHQEFWNVYANKFIADTIRNKTKYNCVNLANYKIVELLSKMEYSEIPSFLYDLYTGGWRKASIEYEVTEWLDRNLKRDDLLMPGAEDVVPAQKPKTFWSRHHNYKQANYF